MGITNFDKVDANTGFYSNGTKIVDASGNIAQTIQSTTATVATTGNTDFYLTAPITGTLSSVRFTGIDALAASDTNYVTFSITNLGQAGAGTAAMLAATDANTSKTTGGTALAANTARSLTVTTTAADLAVVAGDRLRIRVAATGTLANTVTGGNLSARFIPA